MMPKHTYLSTLTLRNAILATFLCLLSAPLIAAPWPLDQVAAQSSITWREGLHLSPDGAWLSYTVAMPDTLPREGNYSLTGVHLDGSGHRRQARITHLESGLTLPLGDEKAHATMATWSPDGRQLAFYSDESGQMQLFLYDLDSRTRRPITGAVPAPYFGFEYPRWSSDGQGLAFPCLTETAATQAKKVEVFSSLVTVKSAPVSKRRTFRLAVLELGTGELTVLGQPSNTLHYAFSPDGKCLAYASFGKAVVGTQDSLYSLRVIDLASGKDRLIASELPLNYGKEWAWSPDSSMIAYLSSQSRGGQFGILYPGGDRSAWLSEGGPNLDWAQGERPPVWGRDGSTLIGCDGESIYSYDLLTRQYQTLAKVEGWSFKGLWSPQEWSGGWPSGPRAHLLAKNSEGETGLWDCAPDGSGLQLLKTWKGDISTAPYFTVETVEGKRLIFHQASVTSVGKVLSYQPDEDKTTEVVRPNGELETGEFGQRKVIEWKDGDGRTLKGVLLLPPDYQGGRLPTLLWVYGGTKGTESLQTFGLGLLPAFNFEVLASRGYAVLEPEIPIRPGHPREDIIKAVMSAADALVEQGYSDPDRLALMGQSYGSYTVLCLLAHTSRFKAAILTAAVVHPDLYADFLRVPSFYLVGRGNLGVTPWQQSELYRQNSPFFQFDRITTPILIGQGSEDAVEVSRSIYNGLRALEKKVELRIYPGESHVLSKPEHVVDFWERRLEFLEQHL